jgi:SAM-dependent methyltransferase
LSRINAATGAYAPTVKAVADVWNKKRETEGAGATLRVLDLGCGYGDMLRAVAAWSRRERVHAHLVGVDLHPWTTQIASRATSPIDGIKFINADAFTFVPEEPPDIVINALFAHHLKDDELTRLMRRMTEIARYGWHINDLHRHWLAKNFIAWATRALRFNRLIRNDAPLSVARGFVHDDWLRLADAAGLDRKCLDVQWHWAFRYGVSYNRPSETIPPATSSPR